MSEGKSTYGEDFYDAQSAKSRESALCILPRVLQEIGDVESIVDVGGGVGTWSAAALTLGVARVVLVDGNWVPGRHLQVPEDSFIPLNLENESLLEIGRFDLAICLEVAEHLSPKRGPTLVQELCMLSENILFSAAIPGQGGTNHINERWLSYWQELFAIHGYGMSDPVRGLFWHDTRVEYWYAQNAVLFRHETPLSFEGIVDAVHPLAFRNAATATQLNPLVILTPPFFRKLIPRPVKNVLKRALRKKA